MIFSVYSVKMLFLFATNTMLLFCQKSKHDLLTKKRIEDDISILLKKSDIHPRTYGISSERKIKEDQRVYSVKYAQRKLM